MIFDRQYCPFLLDHYGAKYLPAESIYAVFEVKQKFNKEYLVQASQIAASVRRLKRTNAPIVHAGGRIDPPKKPGPILAGIVALGWNWKKDNEEPFEECLRSFDEDHHLDLGCCLEKFAFETHYDGSSGPSLKTESENTLILFFMWLYKRLQQLGTVPAIDIDKYCEAILGLQK